MTEYLCPLCACAYPATKRHLRNILTQGQCVEVDDLSIEGALARAAARLARLHGNVSVEVYGATFDAIVEVLSINPVLLARAVMTERIALDARVLDEMLAPEARVERAS